MKGTELLWQSVEGLKESVKDLNVAVSQIEAFEHNILLVVIVSSVVVLCAIGGLWIRLGHVVKSLEGNQASLIEIMDRTSKTLEKISDRQIESEHFALRHDHKVDSLYQKIEDSLKTK